MMATQDFLDGNGGDHGKGPDCREATRTFISGAPRTSGEIDCIKA